MDKESFVNRRFFVESNAITAAYREGRLDAAIGHSYDLLESHMCISIAAIWTDRIQKIKVGFTQSFSLDG